MSLWLRLAIACVRGWTWLYTSGLAPAVRSCRRAEIDSDLWESCVDRRPGAERDDALHVLMRLVLGIPDDVRWRVEQAMTFGAVGPRGLRMSGQAVGAGFLLCAVGVIHVDALRRPPARGFSRPASISQAAPPEFAQTSATTTIDPFVAKLLQHRYPLSVRRGQLSGAGAQLLRSAIEQSRFVLLGEYHGVAQTAEFWAAICNVAAPEGFHTMAVEEGPLVAGELEHLARTPGGLAGLKAFQQKFPDSINVSNAREEFEMLQQCARAALGDFHLWGLNQEMFGAGGLILSRVLASGVGSQSRPAIEQLLQKNDAASRKALQSGNIFDLFMMSADDKELADAARLLQKDGSPEARSLFASLVESHQINQTAPTEYGNARRRERLMKTLFAANYAQAARAAAAPPKALLKFGAFHGYRGLNPFHGSGIGNYIAEFGEGQDARSLHILFLPATGSQPIHPTAGQPAQLRRFDLATDPAFRSLQPALSNLLATDWTMFDLRPLRQQSNRVQGDLATLIFGYDILVLVPEGKPSTAIQ
jgi:hypothetical protein